MHFREVTMTLWFLAQVAISVIGAPTVSKKTTVSNTFTSPPRRSTARLPERMDFWTFLKSATYTPTLTVSPVSTSTCLLTKAIVNLQPTGTNTSSSLAVLVTPPKMTDLAAFNITYFPRGRNHITIVDRVPPWAIKPTINTSQGLPPQSLRNSSVLQVVYPAWSANPAGKPSGGVDFYASPLDLAEARSVTLSYCVFFPVDFKWVKGGKLPGLYGGHVGCSGGHSARTCFSTRLMWRAHGIGELYLYAPKDKQSSALCSDPLSRCDSMYGLSIGRGSFNFTAGAWTCLQQTVTLNEPGKQNGRFTLFVNGQLAINRTDVFYRDAPRNAPGSISKRSVVAQSGVSSTTDEDPAGEFRGLATATSTARQHLSTNALVPPLVSEDIAMLDISDCQHAVTFIGLFFSTFFGGHGRKYATPTEQHVWFQDFVITRNL